MQKKDNSQLKRWEASILKMQDDHFFDIMHAYFGAIKTPFNKHALLERLTGFLRSKSVQQRIVNALSYEDIEILTVIYYLKSADVDSIIHYFFEDHPKTIKDRLINLKERLLIYSEKNEAKFFGNNEYYTINPILIESILPHLNIPFLIPYEEKEERIYKEPYTSPLFFSVMYSYLYNNNDMFKKDGYLKKKNINALIKLFPHLEDKVYIFEDIMYLFTKIFLIGQYENVSMVIDEQWEFFSKLDHLEKIIYLCISPFFYDYMQAYELDVANIFNEFINILQKGVWYCKKDLYRTFYLVCKKYTIGKADDYYYFYESGYTYQDFEPLSIQALKIAEYLELFLAKGELLALNEYFFDVKEDEKPLLISSTFDITVNSDASLRTMLPILKGVDPKKMQTYGAFEFSRSTCARLFAQDMNAKKICATLEELSHHPIPQNVSSSIEQWYESYASISLYQGYVLCVDPKKMKYFENETSLSNIIKKEIKEGVYLLELDDSKEIEKNLKKMGLDFIFFKDRTKIKNLFNDFYHLSNEMPKYDSKAKSDIKEECKKREEEHFKDEKIYLKKLDSLELEKDQKKVLLDRIGRRVVVVEEQVNSSTINNRTREVGALDFFGKIKLLEEARDKKTTLEITLTNNNIIVGHVISIFKTTYGTCEVIIINDAFLQSKQYNLNVSTISKIKEIADSIFS